MEHTTNKSDAPTDPLSGATPANRRTRHIRGALAATTSVGMLFGAGTAVAGASSPTALGHPRTAAFPGRVPHDDARNAGRSPASTARARRGPAAPPADRAPSWSPRSRGRPVPMTSTPRRPSSSPVLPSAGFNDVCVGDTVAVRAAHPSVPGDHRLHGQRGQQAPPAPRALRRTGNTGTPSTTGITARKVFIAPPDPGAAYLGATRPAGAHDVRSHDRVDRVPYRARPSHPGPLPNGSSGAQHGTDARLAGTPWLVSTKDPSSFDVALERPVAGRRRDGHHDLRGAGRSHDVRLARRR